MKQQGLETIKTKDVKKGMYVILPLSWHQHPFVKNQFYVRSDADIEKIRALKVLEIKVDPARHEDMERETPQDAARQNRGKSEAPQRVVPDALETAIRDTKASPEQKAVMIQQEPRVVPDALGMAIRDTKASPEQKAVMIQQESVVMMKNLLDDPTADNIREAKKGISEVVNLILKEEQTLHYLLSITSHDHYTYTHSVSVGVLGVALARSLFKDAKYHDIHALGAGFFLHDLGKVGIDINIINKPGKLTDEEMNEMRRHPPLGFKLLHDTRQLTDECRIIVMQHHERVDGTGYPKGLRGRDIHVYARICAIADVYEALTSDRPYRKRMSPFDALKLMREQMMHHFQRDFFEQFVRLFKPPEEMRA